MKKKLIKFILIPLFFTIPIYLVIIWETPSLFKKYKLVLVNVEQHIFEHIFYEDLDYDGYDEKIVAKNKFDFSSISIHDKNSKFVSETSLQNDFINTKIVFFNDYNKNNLKEIYYFLIRNDSVFLSGFEYSNSPNLFINNKFITTVNKNKNGKYNIKGAGIDVINDIDKDGFFEIYFYISSGHSVCPRRLFAYDIVHDNLYKSPPISEINLFVPKENNFNKNKQPKFYCESYVTSNIIKKHTIFDRLDTSACLAVFNAKLNYKFTPIQFEKQGRIIKFQSLKSDIVVYQQTYPEDNNNANISIYDIQGKLKKQIKQSEISSEELQLIEKAPDNNYVYLISKKGMVFKLDSNLELIDKINVLCLENNEKILVQRFDINNDGTKEMIFSHKNKLSISDSDFKHPSSIFLENVGMKYPQVIHTSKEQSFLIFKANNNIWYKIKRINNEYYNYRFLFFAGIFFLVFIITYLLIFYREKKLKYNLSKLQKTVEERTFEIQKQKEKLELLNQQMFASNIIIDKQNIEVNKKNKEITSQKNELIKKTVDLLVLNRELRNNLKLRSGLTNMIIHDLKNPISNIINLAQSKEVKFFANEILTLVENILDVQKYEGVLMPLKKISVSLKKIVIDAIKQVSLFAERKNIKINNKINNSIIVYADEEILRRIIVNFLSNAIKYSYANETIILDFAIKDNKVIIKIIDTGIGIHKDKINLIFNKFSQIMAKKTGSARSSGLGLTFCKMAVKAHGGDIVVESEPNKSTSFSFNIELSKKTPNTINNSIKPNEKNEIIINNEDIKYLKSFYEEFMKYDVYEIGKLREILKKIDEKHSLNIGIWKKELNKAIYNCNFELYKKLINKIKLL